MSTAYKQNNIVFRYPKMKASPDHHNAANAHNDKNLKNEQKRKAKQSKDKRERESVCVREKKQMRMLEKQMSLYSMKLFV